jgi:hypothetical protein
VSVLFSASVPVRVIRSAVSSSVVTCCAAETGASLIAVTSMVKVLAVVLVSAPLLSVPPLSCTLKPIVA